MSDLEVIAAANFGKAFTLERENVRLRAINAELVAALEEIEKGAGPFDTDQYKFACNVIETAKMIATAAIAKAKGETP